MIIVGIYFLVIHKRRCLSCGRSVRPFWRECSCASEPSTIFSQTFDEEPEGEPEFGSAADIDPFPYDQKPEEKLQFEPRVDTTPIHTPPADVKPADIKPETKPDAKSFSHDDAQPLSADKIGTEVMLPTISSAWLMIQEEGMPEKRYEIESTVTSIGTGADNDIVLTQRFASRDRNISSTIWPQPMERKSMTGR
jgi:hypothetical protein